MVLWTPIKYDLSFFPQGCADLWGPKALRAASGAHFKIPLMHSMPWEEIEISPTSQVFLADNSTPNADRPDQEKIADLQKKCQELVDKDGKDLSFYEEEIMSEFSEIPFESISLSDLNFAAKTETVVIFGGETHGLSGMAKKLALDNNGASIHVPLSNKIESLNVACAASVILYQFLLKHKDF